MSSLDSLSIFMLFSTYVRVRWTHLNDEKMKQTISPIIKAEELLELCQTKQVILIDASVGKDAQAKYADQHLKGSYFVDLNTQLADIKTDVSIGGRHPLPSPQQFSNTLSELGISKDSHVVVFDDKNGANAAARFWWMLKAAGHLNVQVLDGGSQVAIKIGFPTSSTPEPILGKTQYHIKEWLLPTVDLNTMDKASSDSHYLIIDVRDKERYDGVHEPIDLVAGHIPNAQNIPFTNNLDADGFFLPVEELKEKYTKALEHFDTENVIVHCGSGVTACHTLLAMVQAGLEIPQLYVGSWSEWSRNDRTIATNKEV